MAEAFRHDYVIRINPSAWSDRHCPYAARSHSFVYIFDKLGSKCNQAASRLFVKELTLL